MAEVMNQNIAALARTAEGPPNQDPTDARLLAEIERRGFVSFPELCRGLSLDKQKVHNRVHKLALSNYSVFRIVKEPDATGLRHLNFAETWAEAKARAEARLGRAESAGDVPIPGSSSQTP